MSLDFAKPALSGNRQNRMEKLHRYQQVAEKYLDDEAQALFALDRCHNYLDFEAKLPGAYQKSQENQRLILQMVDESAA